MTKESFPVERGRWLKFGFLSGQFTVFTARRVVKVHGDGTATFEVVGQKHEVSKASVLQAMKDFQEYEAMEDNNPEGQP